MRREDDVATIDESAFNQVLSISALALGKLQQDPESTQMEVRSASMGDSILIPTNTSAVSPTLCSRECFKDSDPDC